MRDEIEGAAACRRSYDGAALLTFFVYLLGYLPGLVVNIYFLAEARRTARIAGRSPAGLGCLWGLLLVGLLPLIAVGSMIVAALLGAWMGP